MSAISFRQPFHLLGTISVLGMIVLVCRFLIIIDVGQVTSVSIIDSSDTNALPIYTVLRDDGHYETYQRPTEERLGKVDFHRLHERRSLLPIIVSPSFGGRPITSGTARALTSLSEGNGEWLVFSYQAILHLSRI